MKKKEIFTFGIWLILFVILLACLSLLKIIDVPEAIDLLLLFTLVYVTLVYANRTAEIAKANFLMAEEMKQQRILESKPSIVQRASYDDESSGFEIFNTGNGTAIDVQVIQLDQDEKPVCGERKGFLRPSEEPIRFYPNMPSISPGSNFIIVTEYQDEHIKESEAIWYQTKLPCSLIITNKIIEGKLEFHEVTEKDRVGIFQSDAIGRSKPK